jgi:flagellin
MGFKINTNVAAMNAHVNANMTNRNLDSSLAKLSSGLRINTAADDASGMAIADSLRSQSSALGQAISNANDGIGIIQTADKAMDEQLKILDTIKVKATQAAQDGQSAESRGALQKDINRLLENLNNVAYTTTYNGQSLLAGTFTNKEFQVGAYSNQTVKATIGATSSDKIGATRFETSTNNISQTTTGMTVKFSASGKTFTMESVNIDISAGSGLGALANIINKNANETGVRATYLVQTQGSAAILSADLTGLQVNGVSIGAVSGIQANDADGRLVAAINKVKDQTGVEAFVDTQGRLNLKSNDGRGISMAATVGLSDAGFIAGATGSDNMGRLSLVRLDSRDIIVSNTGGDIGFSTGANSATMNLGNSGANITSTQAAAMGVLVNSTATIAVSNGIGAAVTSLRGAMAVMDIAESAQKMLDTIRADLGSVQNQLTSTINNISITQVNVKAAESNIRDVDFASESANFAKNNILAQSGSYAMSQANAVQQNVLRLLQ